nr:polyprotein [ticpantry virus 5]
MATRASVRGRRPFNPLWAIGVCRRVDNPRKRGGKREKDSRCRLVGLGEINAWGHPAPRRAAAGVDQNHSCEVGWHLILLLGMMVVLLLLLVGGAGALLSPASHACRVGSQYFLTNCCAPADVAFCLEGGCVVALGCTVCTDVCWPILRPGIAVRPGVESSALVGQLGYLYGPLAVGAYASGVLGLGEVYSGALALGVAATRRYYPLPNLTCTVECEMEWGNEFWRWTQEVASQYWIVEFLWRLPFDFWRGVMALTPMLVFVAALLFLEQRLVMLFLLVTTAGMAYGRPTADLTPRTFVPGAGWRCVCYEDGRQVPSERQVWERGNTTLLCECPNGPWVWIPSLCAPVGWTERGVVKHWSHGQNQWPLSCPRYVTGHITATCVRGSISFFRRTQRDGIIDLWSLVDSGSALCTISVLGSSDRDYVPGLSTFGLPCVSCVVDRRHPICGSCTRDCWPETGSFATPFARCGMGPRLTASLSAVPFINRTIPFIIRGPVGYQGHSNPIRSALHFGSYTMTLIDGSLHVVECPTPPPAHPEGTYGFFPGSPPVNNCFLTGTEVSEALGGAGLTGGAFEPLVRRCSLLVGQRYTVCPGFAWVSSSRPDGFIHVKGGVQEVDDHHWAPPPRWLLFDFVFVLLYLMKLAEARLVPLILLLLWWWLNQLVAFGAVAGEVYVGPLAAWCLSLPTVAMILGLVNLILYMKWLGTTRLILLLAWKLARGAFPLALLMGISASRGRTSVLGARFCWDVTVEMEPTILGWVMASVVAWAVLLISSMSMGGWRHKAVVYRGWCIFHQWLRRRVANSPIGEGMPRTPASVAWCLAAYFWPDAVMAVVVTLVVVLGLVDALDWILEELLISRPSLSRLARVVEACVMAGEKATTIRLVQRMAGRNLFLYEHMGAFCRSVAATLREWDAALEPLSFTRTDCRIIRDARRTLSCGQCVAGLPVVARRGDEVLVGVFGSVHDLPPGFVPTAPVVIRRCGKGFLGVTKSALTGRDPDQHPGNVMVLGTTTSRSMGTCLNGLLFTTYHGATSRTIATPVGALNPRWWSPSDDVTVYPLPDGATSLAPCSCQTTSAWVIRADGALCHGTCMGDKVELDVAMEVSDFRGSSGSPVLCDEGHAVGMLVAVLHVGNRVTAARFTRPWNQVPSDAKTTTEPPPVPAKGTFREAPLFLPTGSGKSTRVPLEYGNMGHRVLVLNPSIATVRAMGPYMEKVSGKHPSVYCGHDTTAYTRTTDSPLTYSTYGRFLANPRSMLRGISVVICDECHSHDPTVLLGIGRVRELARAAGVQLVLYATATPPGAPMAQHASIIEAKLDVGEIPFYGHGIPLERMRTGRHLVFCHSKAECDRLAAQFSARGVNAVSYYRGKDSSVIVEGDLVVCATDALSTGYSGNFDSVTDCGLVVEERVEVTLDPTITISLHTVPASAELTMQRRGRTGRGRSGRYYYAGVGRAPAGVVRSGPVWAAIETGISWYGMEPDLTASLLRLYDDCPYTAAVAADIGEAAVFFSGLTPLRMHPDVSWAKVRGCNWPLLVGVQRTMCRETLSPGPSDDPQWAGLKGPNPVPLLLRWGTDIPQRVASHHLVDDLVRRLGVAEGYAHCDAGPILLVGLALAGGMIYASYTGSMVVVTDWDVKGGGTPLMRHGDQATPLPVVQTPPQDHRPGGESAPADAKTVTDAVLAVQTSCDWSILTMSIGDVLALAQSKTAAAYSATCTWLTGVYTGSRAVPTVSIVDKLFAGGWSAVVGHCHSVIAAAVAAYGASRSPPLAAAASYLMGLGVGGNAQVRLASALLLGAAGTALGTPVVGLTMAGAFMGGSSVSPTLVTMLLGAIGGWEGVVNGASLVFDFMAGKLTPEDLWYGIPMLTSPGAGLAGLALGLVLYSGNTAGATTWLNRLLTTLPRSSVIPDAYFQEADYCDRVSALLRRLSLTRTIVAIVTHQPKVDEVQVGYVWDLWEWLMRLLRRITGRLRAMCPVVSLPLWHCGEGWSGEWLLEGHVEARCLCGCVITGEVLNGQLRDTVYSTKMCRHYWMGTVPVNMLGYGETSPLLASDCQKIVPVGTAGWVEVVVTPTHVIVRRSSSYKLLRQQVLSAAVAEPYYVDGIPVSWEADARAPALVYGPGQAVTIDGEKYTLPHQIRVRNFAPSEVSSVSIDISVGEESEDTELTETDLPPAAAALQAIEDAARILEPHIDVIMEDCSTPSLCGSSREMPVWGEDIPRTPSPALISVTESVTESQSSEASSAQGTSPSSESFEVIPESSTEEEGENVFNVALSVLKALFPSSDATRKLTVKKPCENKSVTRYFSLGLTVADVASLCEMEVTSHTAYCDKVRAPMELQIGCLVGNELSFECDQKDDSRAETLTSFSYCWSGVPLTRAQPAKPPVTRPVGAMLVTDTTKVYVTNPDNVGRRVDAVTFWRGPRHHDKFLVDSIERARSAAQKVDCKGYSYEEAIKTVRPHAAMGWGSKASVKSLSTPEGKLAVYDRLKDIERGTPVPFTLTVKKEVFYKDKKEEKAPRLIVFPPLDFRVAEKMILGDPGRVAKAILGDAYAFQYTPNQRVKKMVELWTSKKTPCAICVDAKCFDSSITAEDVELETELYALASDNPTMVKALGKYYAEGPMVSPEGVPLGHRFCRSSGVLTTSSSNCITCYIKVRAACAKIGLKGVSLLVAGDDCLIICERPVCDPCEALGAALRSYGYNCEPSYHASLDTAPFCSTWLAECNAGGARHFFLTTDFRRPLARMSSEYSDPMASAIGYILLYPWHPITRWVVIPHVLQTAFRGGGTPKDPVWCQVHGNYYQFPLDKLPNIIVALHGPAALRVTADTTKTKMEAGKVLYDMKLPGMSVHRKRAGALRARMLRSSMWAELARGLLWHPGLRLKPPEIAGIPGGFPLAPPYMGVVHTLDFTPAKSRWRLMFGFIALILVAIFG